ncbi:MAG: LLM class F420-dependent oxidoreductase [bacterium]
MKFTLCTAFQTPPDIAELAVEAESAGFDIFAFTDHVLHTETLKTGYAYSEDGTRPWGEDAQWADALTTMSYAAARTSTIEFMTAIYVLPMRNPFLVSQQLSTISQLSQRRIWFGVGAGWSLDEFELMEQDFKGRGKRSGEMIEILRKLWRGEMVEHHGEFYDFDRLIMLPKPAKEIPILLGGSADVVLRRAARLADGWVAPPWSLDDCLEPIGKLRSMLQEEGRENDSFEIVLTVSDISQRDDIERAAEAGVTNLICTNPWAMSAFVPGGNAEDLSLEDKKHAVRDYAAAFINS